MTTNLGGSRFTAWDKATATVVALQAAFAAFVGARAPQVIPLHIGIQGQVDRWGDKAHAVVSILALAGVSALVHIVMRRPRTHLEWRKARTWAIGRMFGVATPALISAIIGSMALSDLQPGQDTSSLLKMVAAALLAISVGLGALMGKVDQNPYMGLRCYWTLRSRLAWDKANRLFGRICFFGGLVGLALTPFAPPNLLLAICLGVLLGGGLVSTFESWRVWRIDPDRTP